MSKLINICSQRIACVVPTYNGRDDLARLLMSLKNQSAEFDLILVDSSSNDGTQELANSWVSSTLVIPSNQFNHGGTRQMMVDRNPDYDIYVFLTQDVYLEDSQAIAELVAPFVDLNVGAVCGRQLPHLNADLLAQHARLFNYPDNFLVKSFSDASSLGIKTPFMSNSFSAYRAVALKEVNGFPKHVILSEDMYVAAKMLLAGWKIAYAGEARCRHSHNYTIIEEFRRYFDQGVFHARESWIRQQFGGAGGEGVRYVKSELKFLGIKRIFLWPPAIIRNACKLFAYKLGQKEQYLPLWLKKSLSMHKRYWEGPFSSMR